MSIYLRSIVSGLHADTDDEEEKIVCTSSSASKKRLASSSISNNSYSCNNCNQDFGADIKRLGQHRRWCKATIAVSTSATKIINGPSGAAALSASNPGDCFDDLSNIFDYDEEEDAEEDEIPAGMQPDRTTRFRSEAVVKALKYSGLHTHLELLVMNLIKEAKMSNNVADGFLKVLHSIYKIKGRLDELRELPASYKTLKTRLNSTLEKNATFESGIHMSIAEIEVCTTSTTASTSRRNKQH
jgi:hypothetical protein